MGTGLPGPLVSGLTNEQLTQLMQYIIDHKGVTIATALRLLRLDGRVNPARALKLMEAAARTGHALAGPALEAAAAASRTWLAWLLGVSWVTIGIGVGVGATVIVIGGVIYVYTGDQPIQPGPAMTGPRPVRSSHVSRSAFASFSAKYSIKAAAWMRSLPTLIGIF